MLGRMLAGCALLVSVSSGCKGELNAAYCAEHPEDQDCRFGGLIRLDAPAPECTRNEECTDPAESICDTTAQSCVQCLDEVMEQPCEAIGQKCGVDQQCHGCIVDSHCASTSGVCLPSMSCALESSLLFVSPTGSGSACSKDMPCSLATAVTTISASRSIIKMAPGGYTTAIVVNQPFPVQVIGDGATLESAAVTSDRGDLTVSGLTIEASNVSCIGPGKLTLARVTVTGSPGWGVETSVCDVTIERSRFSSNIAGGMSLSAGTLEVRNNIVDRNGNGNVADGNVMLRNVVGRFVFNTIALNISRSGNRVGGLTCTAGGAAFEVKRNIIAGNGDANNELQLGTCDGANTNFVASDVADVAFASTETFKLSAMSPDSDVLNDPLADADCKRGTGYIDDYEGQPRPVVYCDRGADEYRP